MWESFATHIAFCYNTLVHSMEGQEESHVESL